MKRGTVTLLQGDALRIPLDDGSVHLVVTSPPYFALRSYRDGGEHYEGQIGAEATPLHFLVALWAVMDEVHRVLAPTGSAFVNLGDKFAGSGGHNNAGLAKERSVRAAGGEDTGLASAQNRTTRRQAPDRYNQEASGLLAKSRMLLPHRFAEGLIDPEYRAWIESRIGLEAPAEGHPQWLCRMDVVWGKRNGMPESVTDRVRAAHEYIFHLTKQGDYYASVDAVREKYAAPGATRGNPGKNFNRRDSGGNPFDAAESMHPLGKLPGSVWTMATEPLITPEYMVLSHGDDPAPAVWLKDDQQAWAWAEAAGVLSSPWPRPTGDAEGPFLMAAPDHFAAFPSELPTKAILGWSPSGICSRCGEGRRLVVERERVQTRRGTDAIRGANDGTLTPIAGGAGFGQRAETTATITGETCACPEPEAPTTPAVVLDPFGGTGTTAIVAAAFGRDGVSLDLSADYLRLAHWRANHSGLLERVRARAGLANPKGRKANGPADPAQVSLFG